MSGELETPCVQLDDNVTNGSAIVITYPHHCDSGRSKKTEKVAVERENFSRSTLAMPNTPLSIRNKSTMINTFEKSALVNKVPSPSNGPILSPETTHILENAEKLVENVQKKIVEINHDILFHKENPEISSSQPTIDEDLLHLRQMVAFKFQQVNNPSKVHNENDHAIFTNSVLQVPEKEINEIPRLLKLLTMLPERRYLETKNEESYCKTVPSDVKCKLLSTDSIPNQCETNVQDQNESSTNKKEKAAQADEKQNKLESSTFQIQTGPRVIIKRSLQIQNVECLHISPGSSVKEPTNVGIYNFQHETPSERNAINQDHIIIESDRKDNTFLEEETVQKKQMFRKSVVLKNTHESKLSFRNDSKRIVEKLSESNNFSRDRELSSKSPRKIIQGNSTISPEQCNIGNAKAKAFSEFLINLKKDLDNSNASNKVEDSGEIKTRSETCDSDEKSQLEKVKENLIEGQSNAELKNAGCKSGKLTNKATIISNETVNFNYKNIFKDNVVNPTISKSCCQINKTSEDSEVKIDDINLKEPSVFYLDAVLKRNDEIINNVLHGSDKFYKIISSKLKAYNNLINQENKKVDQTVKFASVTKSKPPDEMKKSSIEKFSEEKENDLKLYSTSDNILDDIISGTNKFSKFISARSEINNSVINQESVLNSHSINLSSASLSLISSTKNLVSQKPLSSHMKKSSSVSSVSSNEQYGSELNDFSIKDSSGERNIKLFIPSSERSSKNNFEEKRENENEKINEEEKSVQIVLMQNKFDNFQTKEGKEFPKSFKNQSSNTDEIKEDDTNCKPFASKPLLNSDVSSNNHNMHYAGPSLQRKENDFSEMEIFGHVFESLRHSSAAMKRFITCLFGETEARIENEIIGILRETSVHPIIINKFLLILQRRDKNSQLPIFTTNIGLYLNLNEESRDSFTLRKHLQEFWEGGRSIVSLDSESNRKLSNDQLLSNDRPNKNENNDKKSTQIRLEFDVTSVDKKDLYSDSKLAVTQKELDLPKSAEENNELLIKKSNEVFSLENQSKIEKVLNRTNAKPLIDETDKKTSCISLKKSQEINKNLNKMEIRSNSTNISSDIKLVESGPSVSECSKRLDYSQNFTDSSSTSKDCKSLESHVSLKLSDSFMNKKEVNKETIAERSDELEIQKKIDDLLNREQRVALSVEKSIRTEIDNLTKERSSEKNIRRKPLIRGKTFIIKNSDIGLNTKVSKRKCSDVNSSLSDSQKESNLKVPSRASESSERNIESSSETYSEGEVHLPSSGSYSLGEIRLSEQEKLPLRKPDEDTINSKTADSCKKQHSGSSSYMSNSLTRSLGEV